MPQALPSPDDPAVEDLQADLLGLISEHDATPHVALAALVETAITILNEKLTPRQADLLTEQLVSRLENVEWE